MISAGKMAMFYRAVERVFVCLLLLSSMGVVDGLTRPEAPRSSGDWFSLSAVEPPAPLITVILQIGIYATGAVLVGSRWRTILRSIRASVWPLILFVCLGPLSLLWSIDPSLTLKRSALLLFFSTLAIYLGERYSIDELAQRLAEALCAMIIAVILMYFVSPGHVLDPRSEQGAWMGLSGHKNTFGQYMAISIVVLLLVRFRRFGWARYAFLLAAAILLLLSHSVAALADCLLTLGAVLFLRLTRLGYKDLLFVVLIFAVLAASAAAIYLTTSSDFDSLRLLGRDATLSGRTRVWPLVIQAIAKRPVLGYGYGTFWSIYQPEGLQVWLGAGFLVRAADQGYLELCLGYGLVGLILFGCVFVYYLAMAVRYCRSRRAGIALWPVAYLVFFALNNTTESTLMLSWRSLPWLMFMALATSLALHQRQKEALVLRRVPHAKMGLPNDWPAWQSR